MLYSTLTMEIGTEDPWTEKKNIGKRQKYAESVSKSYS